MKTKEYLDKYRLQEGDNKIFDKKGLLQDLNREFIEMLDKHGEKLTFTIFHSCIKQINNKFWAISNKRKGLPFTSGYWNVFYMEYIIAQRAIRFPEKHAELEALRLKRPQNNS